MVVVSYVFDLNICPLRLKQDSYFGVRLECGQHIDQVNTTSLTMSIPIYYNTTFGLYQANSNFL